MTRLSVPGMTCGHCKTSVESAIATLDAAARVHVDLPSRMVEVSSIVPPEALIAALKAGGYDATVAA